MAYDRRVEPQCLTYGMQPCCFPRGRNPKQTVIVEPSLKTGVERTLTKELTLTRRTVVAVARVRTWLFLGDVYVGDPHGRQGNVEVVVG
jgi:hypothetical protein